MKYFIGIAFILLISCTKKQVAEQPNPQQPDPQQPQPELPQKIDTIKPSSYFPAFPGSYWKYMNEQGDTLTHRTSAGYEKDKVNEYSQGTVTKTTTAYVPKYNNIFIWNGYAHSHIKYRTMPLADLVAIVDDNFVEGREWRSTSFVGSGNAGTGCKILKKDTAIVIDGKTYYPTIVVGTYGYGNPESTPILISKSYYTKDIGLVVTEKLLPLKDTLRLVEYHINK
ncbi:hypothetical protein CNR22_12840 [Sphingobacteriaceae bacterium]|nr:hypothetical protein CNR22_12840 [Sphingobacteriaceae bacterium]